MILESGVAGGRSTEIFARMFPDKQIIAVDDTMLYGKMLFVKTTERLKRYRNVSLRIGNSFNKSPNILNAHPDKKVAVLIDGPKGTLAGTLAKMIIGCPNVEFVAAHDANASYSYGMQFNWKPDHDWVEQYRYLEEDNINDPYYIQEMKNYLDGWGIGFMWRKNYEYSGITSRSRRSSSTNREQPHGAYDREREIDTAKV
jgi:hypothetical protein